MAAGLTLATLLLVILVVLVVRRPPNPVRPVRERLLRICLEERLARRQIAALTRTTLRAVNQAVRESGRPPERGGGA